MTNNSSIIQYVQLLNYVKIWSLFSLHHMYVKKSFDFLLIESYCCLLIIMLFIVSAFNLQSQIIPDNFSVLIIHHRRMLRILTLLSTKLQFQLIQYNFFCYKKQFSFPIFGEAYHGINTLI